MPLAFHPSANIARLKESATLAVAARARALKAAGRDIIDLGAGEPDFDTPQFIRDAAVEALAQGATRYTATEGILPLREAIAADANGMRAGGAPVTPAEVVVSSGSKQSLYNACVCCFGPGDEVLVPTPAWTSYYEMLELARATAVPVFGEAANALKVTADQLAAAATPRTRGLMLNSPSNPTGAVYGADELRAILELAAGRGWWVISDEIYRRIAYDAPAHSALELAPARDNLIVVNGVAKAYAMTGWRIGWAIAPPPVAKAMTAFQSHTTSNAAAVSQHAALAALARREEADAAVAHMVREFHRRRDAVLAALAPYPQVRVVHPAGAFYLYVHVGGFEGAADPGARFAEVLLERENVAVVPGGAFLTPDWIRASYATRLDVAVEGVTRIARCFSGGQET
jgi:aspartate aminotransferase